MLLHLMNRLSKHSILVYFLLQSVQKHKILQNSKHIYEIMAEDMLITLTVKSQRSWETLSGPSRPLSPSKTTTSPPSLTFGRIAVPTSKPGSSLLSKQLNEGKGSAGLRLRRIQQRRKSHPPATQQSSAARVVTPPSTPSASSDPSTTAKVRNDQLLRDAIGEPVVTPRVSRIHGYPSWPVKDTASLDAQENEARIPTDRLGSISQSNREFFLRKVHGNEAKAIWNEMLSKSPNEAETQGGVRISSKS